MQTRVSTEQRSSTHLQWTFPLLTSGTCLKCPAKALGNRFRNSLSGILCPLQPGDGKAFAFCCSLWVCACIRLDSLDCDSLKALKPSKQTQKDSKVFHGQPDRRRMEFELRSLKRTTRDP